MRTVLDAVAAFWDYLASVQPLPLAIAIGCHIAKTMCTSRAWRNVLAAAYPEARVSWPSIYAAYIAGVGVNAIFPARAGDVVRLTMAHRAVKGATYTTLVSSSLVLAIVDAACALALFVWALTQGVFPSLDALPSLPSFDFAWFLDHEQISQVLLVVAVFGLIALAIWIRSQRRRVPRARRPGVHRRSTRPARWLRTVVVWQLADWALRLTTIWFMLDAFGIDQSLRNVLLVQASQSLATLVPVSPGGVGTEQAFLVYTLRGQAARSALLAFSVGMKLTLTAVNVLLGFAAILLTLRGRSASGKARPTRPAIRAPAERSQDVAGPPVRWSWPNTVRAVFAGSPGTASSSSCDGGEEAVGRAEVLQDRAAPGRPDAVQRVEDRLEGPRVALLAGGA